MGGCISLDDGRNTYKPVKIHVPANLRISWTDIKIDETIGRGGSGEVSKGRWQGNRVAVKQLAKEFINDDRRRNLVQEAVLMAGMQHPCIARVYGLVDEQDHLALVMQYYRKGTLEEFMTRPATRLQYQELDLMKRVSMAVQVARGIAFLHDRKVLHGDIKTSNLLMDENDGVHRVFITDFGLARSLDQSGKRYAPSPSPESSMLSVHISPPEVLKDPFAPREAAVDVYAFGIVLLEIMTGQSAFKGMNAVMVEQVIKQGKRPVLPADLPDEIKHVINKCWAQDPADRPAASEVVKELEQILRTILEQNSVIYDATIYTKLI